MKSKRIDLRDLTSRLGRLGEVRRAAERVITGTWQQPPLEPFTGGTPADFAVEPYYLVPGSLLEALRAAVRACDATEPGEPAKPRPRLELVRLEDRRPLPAAGDALEIVIDRVPDRANATNRISRGAGEKAFAIAYRSLKEEKARIVLTLSEWKTDAPRYTVPLSVEVVIEWGRPFNRARGRLEQSRPLDPDGAAGALKPWLDALTAVGIWADDRLAAPDFRIIQRSSEDGAERTTIRIRPLEITDANAAARNPAV